ncbi:SGNH/GDSL hydrolase family protein [Granulicella sibirica]|uniref:Lipolytic enzyme, G-D-S-L n=1 Tax=Granulicella sibirica TaxID=2479048 RepID=A0A4Q0T5K1_9BACT|nr:SGNH/GDSL hydrolase family protein [Granulicella sibirica]RXH57900.1 Lipolytic enzyme, G-D-S-L precursor [Granulicella sibirica]
MIRMGWMGVALLAGVATGYGQGTTLKVGQGVVTSGQPSAASPSEADRMKKQLADWPQLGRYAEANKALPAETAGRVVFYGDSITDNWAKPANASVFFPGKPYVGRGISGQTTPQMVVRFRQDVIDLHPEAVVILAGTNDVAGNTGPMTPLMTEENIETMADLAKAHGIRVILCSILPAFDFPWRKGLEPAPKIIALNAWMKDYAAKSGITYVDYHSVMTTVAGGMKDGLSSDGVHPTAAGYAIMEPLVEKSIDAK